MAYTAHLKEVILSSGFSTAEFLDFATASAEPGLSSRLFAVSDECVFPCYEIEREPAKDESRFLITPICLSGPQNMCFHQLFSSVASLTPWIKGGFIQTRCTSFPDANFKLYGDYYAYFDARINFRLSLDLDNDSYVSSLHRYSKYAIRKALAQRDSFSLSRFSGESSELENFARIYEQTALRVGFDNKYRFRLGQWQRLLESASWTLYLLKYQSEVIAGAVISGLESGYDYTFAASEPSVKDSSRVLLYSVREELARNSNGTLDIGGGITDDDSLSAFKRNMGGVPVNFVRCRFGHRELFDSQADAFEHLSNRWP